MIQKTPFNCLFYLPKWFLPNLCVPLVALLLGVFLYVFSSTWAFALDPKKQISQYIIDQWTTRNGLPTNTLNNVHQSKDGFIWASTYSGLIRFDGIEFKVFDKKNFSQLTNSSISSLYQTQDDSLWIGTHGSGLIVQKDHNFNFYTAITTKGNFPDYSIESIVKATNGALWIGTRGHGIMIYKNGVFTPFTTISEINSISINELQYGESGANSTVWIGTEGKGLFSYQNEIVEKYNVENGALTNNVITGLLLDKTNTLWVGTINGLNKIRNGKSESIKEFDGIAINDILKDKEGSIWFATSAGLFRKNPITNQYEILNTENGLPHNNVMHLSTDVEGNLWLAMYRAGLIRLKDGKFVNYTVQQGLASVSVSSVQEIEKGVHWVGSDAGIINTIQNQNVGVYSLKKPLLTDRLRSIFKDREGNVWIASYAGLLRISSDGSEKLFTTNDGLTDNQVRVVTQTINGSIWIGTRGGGLNEYSPSDQTWIPFTKEDGLTSNFIMGVEPTQDGNLIVSMNDAGVNIINLKTRKVSKIYTQTEGLLSNLAFSARYDSKNILWICANSGLVAIAPTNINKIHLFSPSNGFPVDAVFDIREDNNTDLWLSSSQGVIRIDRNSVTDYLEGKRTDLKTEVFDRSDGMKEEECTGAVHFHKDSQGRMWFPTIGGLSMINPNQISKNTLAPPTYITKMSVDSMVYNFSSLLKNEKISIEAGARRVIFYFTGLSLVSPSDMHFKYRLKGFDEDWIEVINERNALYTGLAPKEYTFEVMAANNDGVWSEEIATVNFKIKPFFYQTPYFWVAVVLLFLVVVFLAYRYQIRRIKIQNLKLEETVQQRTAEINQQKEEIESQRDRIEDQRQAISVSYQQIHKVGEIGQKITAKLQTDTLVQTIYQNILVLMPAEGFGIGMCKEEESKIEFRNYIEHGELLPVHSDSLSQVNRFSVQCFTKKKSILINDLEEYFTDKNQLKYLDIGKMPQSLIYVPLVIDEKTVGVLTVQSFRKNAYTKEDVVILEALAAYISIAQSNAKSYEIIQEKNRNITDSIRYALTIQQAVLPTPEEMNRLFNDYFVIFKPKDIVSGDFYWAVNYKGKTFVAIVDCTGHGVPGGFMSMIGNALLNEIVTIERIFSPAAILEKLHQDVRAALQQEKAKNDDGMDISIFSLDKTTEGNKITFAGAKQSIYYVENHQINKLKGDRMSIGGRRSKRRDITFNEQTIMLPNNSMIYMMTDGFADQSDLQGQKIGSNIILEQLAKVENLSADKQKQELETLLEQHQRTAPQRDDITLLGIRL